MKKWRGCNRVPILLIRSFNGSTVRAELVEAHRSFDRLEANGS